MPGIPGIGPKTAQELLEEFESFEELWEFRDEVESPRLRKIVEESVEKVRGMGVHGCLSAWNRLVACLFIYLCVCKCVCMDRACAPPKPVGRPPPHQPTFTTPHQKHPLHTQNSSSCPAGSSASRSSSTRRP